MKEKLYILLKKLLLIEEIEMTGIITKQGKILILKRIGSDTGTTKISLISVGDDSTAPSINDTDLKNKVPVNGTTIDSCESTSGWLATNGTISLNENYISPNYSISLSKTSTTNTNCYCEKTFTSFSIQNKKVYLFAFFSQSLLSKLASTESFWIRLGSNSSNYFYLMVDLANLTQGWKYFVLNEELEKVGSPNASSITYMQIGYKTSSNGDTTNVGDFCFDNILLVGESNYLLPFSVNYPIVDNAGLILKIRSVLSSADALGFNLSEVGIKNSENVLYSRDVYLTFRKNEYIEVIYYFEDIIE